jgi:hypothetical protein
MLTWIHEPPGMLAGCLGHARSHKVKQVGRFVRVKVKGRVVSWHPESTAVPF